MEQWCRRLSQSSAYDMSNKRKLYHRHHITSRWMYAKQTYKIVHLQQPLHVQHKVCVACGCAFHSIRRRAHYLIAWSLKTELGFQNFMIKANISIKLIMFHRNRQCSSANIYARALESSHFLLLPMYTYSKHDNDEKHIMKFQQWINNKSISCIPRFVFFCFSFAHAVWQKLDNISTHIFLEITIKL